MNDPEHELTLNLYIISRRTHDYYARELRRLGLTMGQFPFVMGIVENDGLLSQEELSARVGVGKSTTAEIIRQLMAADLVTRIVDPLDRRTFRLHATARAIALVPEIRRTIDACHTKITAELTESEQRIFAGLTCRVRHAAETALRIEPDAR